MAKTERDQAGAGMAQNLGHSEITAMLNGRTVAGYVASGGAIRAVLPGHVIPGQMTSPSPVGHRRLDGARGYGVPGATCATQP